MTFQIHGLPEAAFANLFELSDAALQARRARRVVVDEYPAAPCRVSMADASVGETVILTNYQHHAEDSPYQASHAIYIRKGATQAHLEPGEIPAVLERRLLSVRGFNEQGDITNAEVVEGTVLQPVIEQMLEDTSVAYLHLHYAKRGCFAAKVTRAD